MIFATMTTNEILVILGVPALAGLIIKLFWDLTTGKYKKVKEETRLIRKALQAMLRDKLRQHYIHYIDEGHISYDDKQNFDNLYQIYHSLGKNGVMNNMYAEVMDLPITKGSKHIIKKDEG